MNKIFDLFFSPKIFFKDSRFGPFDAIFVTLLIWIVNMIIIFPTFKNMPLFGGFIPFAIVVLVLLFIYELFSGVIHKFLSKDQNVFWGLPYALVPHILTGWIISVAIFWEVAYIFLIIPIAWSVILEFYLVRSSTGRGILYTLVIRASRDLVFFAVLSFILRRWFL
uniref:Uncharacterized protein n=1 Tax=Mesoaciditoga lauensis TaxID=1495039 RepID=A0A7V3RFC7_9BACT